MLVLSRHIGQKILIGEHIEVLVVDLRDGNKVRLGIQAPREVSIDRAEVRESKVRDGVKQIQTPTATKEDCLVHELTRLLDVVCTEDRESIESVLREYGYDESGTTT